MQSPSLEPLEPRRLLAGTGTPTDPLVITPRADDVFVLPRHVVRDLAGNLLLDQAPPRVLRLTIPAGTLSIRLGAGRALLTNQTARKDVQPVTYHFALFRDANNNGQLDAADVEQPAFRRDLIEPGTLTASGALPAGVYFARFAARGGDVANPSIADHGTQAVDATGSIIEASTFVFSTTPPSLPFATLDGAGTLAVNGTPAADTIDLSVAGDALVVRLGALSRSFPLAAVRKVAVNAGNGNDTVNLHTVNKPSVINGGTGNDTLIGGAGDDSFDGGAGADVIDGGIGGVHDEARYVSRTEAITVSLDDLPNDGSSTDAASPTSTTRDNVRSNVEVLQGGSGNDVLSGSRASNTLIGDAGNDTLIANGGNDLLFGGAGDDTFFARDNTPDSLEGGLGTDTATVDAIDQHLKNDIEKLLS